MSSLSDLRTATRRYINETNTTNTNFPDTELNDYLNQATLFLGTQMEWPIQTYVATATANQALYQLPSDFIELLDVYWNEANLPLLDRADLGKVSPTWQQDPAGTPKVCYKFDQQTIGLYNVPDTNQQLLGVSSYLLEIQYIALPATLVNDTDIPNLQTAYQMCLPFYAAFICEHRLGNDKKADSNLQRFDQHRKALMARIQKFSDDLLRFRWAGSYPERNT
jgi:hypothetical protein